VQRLRQILNWLFGPEPPGPAAHLWPRWFFLRALGLIYFSAFYSLAFQIQGLLGPSGLLPAGEYLQAVSRYFGPTRFWFAPTLLWFRSGDRALELLCWMGMLAALLVVFNILPRISLGICFVAFLSFVAAARDFSGYQSDGMLLEAGFISLFFAPAGWRPALGAAHAPSRAALYLLRWEWFRIYFESGVAKMASGDLAWRHLTAMDDYYQNGPLPTWIGWYVQQFPHWFHASTAFLTLALELVLVWTLFLPRRFRIILFLIVTPWEIGIILTANYTFLNYLVLSLGILLLDDRFVEFALPAKVRGWVSSRNVAAAATLPESASPPRGNRGAFAAAKMVFAGILLAWVFYASTALLVGMLAPQIPLPETPARLLEPLRIADRYGLFAVMTHERNEIEFQGSRDGKTWIAYPFRYKPQDVHQPPGIYAPYQPRFDWNLWFASLGPWQEYPFVVSTEERLLRNTPEVLALFAGNPFGDAPPQTVRAVLWQYRFTDRKTKREQGAWWRREVVTLYCPALTRLPDGKIIADDSPDVIPRAEHGPQGRESP